MRTKIRQKFDFQASRENYAKMENTGQDFGVIFGPKSEQKCVQKSMPKKA